MRYGQIQPMLFPLSREGLPQRDAYQLFLPDAWREVLYAAARKQANRDKATPRYGSLHTLLRGTLPSLIDVNWSAWRSSDQYWLLSEEQVAPEVLVSAVVSWLRVEYAKLPRLAELVKQIQPEHLQWQSVPIQLGDGGPTGSDFRLVPNLVAQELAREGVVAKVGAESLHWHRVAVPDQGAEVISSPPCKWERGGKVWYYSYVLTFTVQTLPGDRQGYLHMDVGVRRWMTGQIHLPRGNTSTYIQAPDSWLAGDGRRVFCVAPAGWMRADADSYVRTWKDNLPAILGNLHHIRFPDLEAVVAKPEEFLLSSETRVGIGFRNAARQSHGVGAGANPADRSTLFAHVCDQVKWLKPAVRMPKAPVRKASEPAEDPVSRSEALHRFAGAEVHVEIWYQQEHVVERLKKALIESLGLSSISDNEFRTDSGKLMIKPYLLPDTLTCELPIPDKETPYSELQPVAVERAGLIGQYIKETANGSAPGTSLAFVQISNQQGQYNDAKTAIRSGFAQTGRLTQCLFGRDKGLTQKVLLAKYENTALDLLRQTGSLPKLLGRLLGAAAPSVPANTSLVGLWLIRRNEGRQGYQTYLPVAVRVRLDAERVEARLVGQTGWVPYPELLLKLPGVQSSMTTRQVQEGISRLLQELRGEPTLLMVDAQKLRGAWTWLGNNRLIQDGLFVYPHEDAPTFQPDQLPGLRIVRVRDNTNHETPQWYAVEGVHAGITDGLFPISDRLIHSIAPKAKTMQSNVRKPKTVAPGVRATMPAILEMAFPFLQPADDVMDWAWAVHLLRSVHSHFDDATVLPLPLHLAAKMEEYLVQVPVSEPES